MRLGGDKHKGAGRTRRDAFTTDIFRTITGDLKRFVSLFVITALGATMLVGLKAACDDLRFTADDYYDEQSLFDISVQSTLGLDEDDIDALGGIEGVDVAEGGYSETVYTQVDGASQKVDLKSLSPAGLNEPQVVEGRLPEAANELAVTRKYLDASGKGIGDVVTFEGADDAEGDADAAEGTLDAGGGSKGADASDPIFKRGEYVITGVVLDPMDVNAGSKTMSFRSSGGAKYAFFLTTDAVVDRDTFTVAYLTVSGAADLRTYSEAYEAKVDEVKQRVEAIREEREEARTAGVKGEALSEIDEREAEADGQIAEAAAKLDDAQAQIDDALAQIESGNAELARERADAERRLSDAQTDIEAGLAIIDGEQAKLDAASEELNAALAQIEQAEAAAESLRSLLGEYWPADTWSRLQEGDATAVDPFTDSLLPLLRIARLMANNAISTCGELEALIPDLPTATDEDKARIEELLDQLDLMTGGACAESIKSVRDVVGTSPVNGQAVQESLTQIASIKAVLTASIQSFDEMLADDGAAVREMATAVASKCGVLAGLNEVESGQARLDAERTRAYQGLGQLDAARAEMERRLEEGASELRNAAAEVDRNQSELDEGRAELEEQKAEAETEFADARAEVDGMDGAVWYIQDRGSLASYASVESDAGSIESIATVFPPIFFSVAVLISLTTVTRMVEEDRGLIGIYKALGYSRARILSKYLIYSFSACLLGGIAGDALGFIVLPEVLFVIFKTMYELPPFQLHFNVFTALIGITLFAIGIVGATYVACRHVLRETPASLMRPKAPRAGKRILLERITPVWSRMGFLNKVSARNLFRYKKRFLMTVFGIAGCTALMICGLGIRDTVISLKPRQYGDDGIVRYDLMAVTADGDLSQGERELRDTGSVESMLEVRIDTVTVEYAGVKESIQLVVVPNDADLSAYMKTEDGSETTFLKPATGGRELDVPREGNGVLVTKNIEQVLGLGKGDELEVQDASLRTGAARVDGITVNFLGNFMFMSEDAYRACFGEDCVPNAFLVNLKGTDAEKIALSDELTASDTFVSVSSSTKIANDFTESFKIIDVVVYVVTVLAAALAFAVVFTLSNTNISERERELATIKVLGFRRREVYRYINKETIVLTLIGIVAGWPLGYLIARFLTYTLRMPSLFFDTVVEPQTYLFASVMSLTFTLIINLMTNRSLDKIDMVGALKSAE